MGNGPSSASMNPNSYTPNSTNIRSSNSIPSSSIGDFKSESLRPLKPMPSFQSNSRQENSNSNSKMRARPEREGTKHVTSDEQKRLYIKRKISQDQARLREMQIQNKSLKYVDYERQREMNSLHTRIEQYKMIAEDLKSRQTARTEDIQQQPVILLPPPPPKPRENEDCPAVTLKNMGFCENQVNAALENCNGNISAAIEWLIKNIPVDEKKEDIEKVQVVEIEVKEKEEEKEKDIVKEIDEVPDKNDENKDKDEDEEKLCVVCLEFLKDTVLIPCGHVCLCFGCSKAVQDRNQCPICRGAISGVYKVFL